MNLRSIRTFRPILLLSLIVVTADSHALLFGLLPFRKKQESSVKVPPKFGWENEVLTVKGAGTATALQTPQVTQEAARRQAFTECMNKLTRRVEGLKVAGGMKLGALMRENLAIRHAVEIWVQKHMQVTYQDKLSGLDSTGITSFADARLSLTGLVRELARLGITPTTLPSAQPLPTTENLV